MTTFAITVPDWFLYFACVMMLVNVALQIMQAILTRRLRKLTEENERVEKFFKENKQ